MAGSYADWLQRGRVHQWEGRPVDAMLCFQRAAVLAPTAADPRYLLGEVQWQLGRIAAAVAAWRDAARVAPGHAASHLALAEALLALGQAGDAFTAAATAIALTPGDPDAVALHAITAWASGHAHVPLTGLAGMLATDVRRLAAAAPGGALAEVLLREPRPADADALLVALVPHAQRVAFALLLPLVQAGSRDDAPAPLREALPAFVEAALSRDVPERDVDALRRMALALTGAGHAEPALALAKRYADACVTLAPPDGALDWPRRPAPARLRVHVLIASDVRAASLPVLDRAASREVDLDWTLLVAGEPFALTGALAKAHVRLLPRALDADLAAALSHEAADLVIDTAGLGLDSGRLLASRPAFRIVAMPVARAAHTAPLVDETVAPDDASFAGVVARAREAAQARPQAAMTAADFSDALDRAVEAHRAGSDDEAIAIYERLIEDQPMHVRALHLLAALRRTQGAPAEAAALLARAVSQAPRFVPARAAAARVAREQGRVDEGLTIIDEGLALNGRAAELWRVRGELELARHDGVAAEAAFAHALALAPADAEAHYNFGVALQKQGRASDAARAYQRALAFDPAFADPHFNLGVLFQQGGATDASVSAYRAVLERDAKRVAAYRNLGEVLLAAGRIDEWIANFRRFEASCPDALPLAVQALEVCQYAADFAALERYLEGLRQERFKTGDAAELVDALEQLLYLLLFFDVEPEMIHRFAQTYSATAPAVYGAPLERSEARSPGKLRIGYLSADLRNHVMGKMMWQALQHHDRDRFALHFYALSGVRDEWTARFQSIAERFEVIAGRSEHDAALRIAADDLDLLVDLSGHTKGAKPGILARKPARVQMTHVASAGSVGLDTVDYKLTDRFADLPANQETMIERLLPMEGCVYPFRHVAPAADHPFTRAALRIAPDAIVIGAFVAPMKLSRRCLTLWRDVLARIPRALLAFSPTHPALRPVFEGLVRAAGIAPERVRFVPQGRDDAQNQARYTLVDFVLDPMPFGGVNGVIEPLDAGVPVVTLLGKRHGERSAYTILANLGVTATVAEGGREYVDIAVRLAEEPAFMASVRADIATGLARSPLVDMRAHARHLEAAYLTAIERKG